jgi:hypothetical protein
MHWTVLLPGDPKAPAIVIRSWGCGVIMPVSRLQTVPDDGIPWQGNLYEERPLDSLPAFGCEVDDWGRYTEGALIRCTGVTGFGLYTGGAAIRCMGRLTLGR